MMYGKLYKKLSDYSLIVFDMDGTMYFQKSMQVRMGIRLMMHALFDKGGMKDMKIILGYRKLREDHDSSQEADDDVFFSRLSEQYGTDMERIRQIIDRWMFVLPLDAVKLSADHDLAEVVRALLSDGKEVCIYSDYPAKDKCEALGLPKDLMIFCCGDDGIRKMKPDPEGLGFIMGHYPDIPKEKIVMTGDRKDRDALAAANAGIDSVILGRFRIQRRLLL